MSCLFDPGACVQAAFWNVILGVPWWAWALLVLVLLGAAWKFAGIPGLVAGAAAIGFIFGRFRAPDNQDSENVPADSRDGALPHRTKPARPSKPPTDAPGTWNRREGRWN